MNSRLLIITFIIAYGFAELNQPEFICPKWKKDSALNARILDTLKGIKTFRANFEQTSFSGSSLEVDIGNGIIFGKKPKSVKLEYSVPEPVTFTIVEENAVSINRESGESEYFKIEDSDMSRLPVSLIIDGKLGESLIYVGSCENFFGYVSKFDKISGDKTEYSLTVVIGKNFDSVKGVKFEDFGGVVNMFLFKNFLANIELSDSFFEIPKE